MTDLTVLMLIAAIAYAIGLKRLLAMVLGERNHHILTDKIRSVLHRLLSMFANKHAVENSFAANPSQLPKSCQIEHIFLIDRDSGIQIEEVASNKELDRLNGDAISAMFSAIQSFVQDAFSRERSSRLTDLTVGDYSICVAHGPRLMLACVVVGKMPKGLKKELEHTLMIIQRRLNTPMAPDSQQGAQTRNRGVARVMKDLITSNTPIASAAI